MPVVHEKVSGETNPIDGRVGGEDWDASHLGSSDWDYTFSKASDQGVTNSATLVDESGLAVSVTAGGVYRVEWEIAYTSDATGDFKWDLSVNSGTMSGWVRYVGSDTTANAILVSTGVRFTAVATTADVTAGGGTAPTLKTLFIEAMMETSASTALNFRFAQNTQTSGQTATVKQGSTVRARRIA